MVNQWQAYWTDAASDDSVERERIWYARAHARAARRNRFIDRLLLLIATERVAG